MYYSQSLVLNRARLPIDAMYNNFIMEPAIAGHDMHNMGGGEGDDT